MLFRSLCDLGEEKVPADKPTKLGHSRLEFCDCPGASRPERGMNEPSCREAGGKRPAPQSTFLLHGGRVFALDESTGAPVLQEERQNSETAAERKRREDELEAAATSADAQWRERADRKEWDHVKVDLEVYRYVLGD